MLFIFIICFIIDVFIIIYLFYYLYKKLIRPTIKDSFLKNKNDNFHKTEVVVRCGYARDQVHQPRMYTHY
jgi:hypothetical protein